MISEFPLFIFSTCSGLAAGAYIFGAFFSRKEYRVKWSWLYSLVLLALLGIGLCGTLGHLGHPERFLNALANPQAMITQEAYWSIGFGILLLVDFVFCFKKKEVPYVVQVIGAFAALGLILVTSWAYFSCYAVTVWNQLATLPLFVVGDLAMGGALFGAFVCMHERQNIYKYAMIVLEILLLITLGCEAYVFAQAGQSVVLYVIALVIGPLATLGIMVFSKKQYCDAYFWALFVCTFLSVAFARYCFYAASIL